LTASLEKFNRDSRDISHCDPVLYDSQKRGTGTLLKTARAEAPGWCYKGLLTQPVVHRSCRHWQL